MKIINKKLDLIIVGGSAVATASAIYSARRELNFKVVASEWGGEVAKSGEIGNYPGFKQTDGIKLADIFRKQLEYNKVQIDDGVTINEITKHGEGNFLLKGKREGEPVEYRARAVLVGTGVHPRQLNARGEKHLRNRGISYCTTCDGPLFKNKVVATIGGGNSAMESALMLKDIAKQVYLLNINQKLKGETIYITKLQKAKNIQIINRADTQEFFGKEFLQKLKYLDKASGKKKELAVEGAFIHIGLIPNSDFLPPEVEKNNFGEIKVNRLGETSLGGLFSAGDVTDIPYKQIAIATGTAVIATLRAIRYINSLARE